MIRYDSNDHHKNSYERESPVEESRWWFQHTGNLEDDQLEKRQTERERDWEDELNADVFDLIVLEQLLHEEDQSADKE